MAEKKKISQTGGREARRSEETKQRGTVGIFFQLGGGDARKGGGKKKTVKNRRDKA